MTDTASIQPESTRKDAWMRGLYMLVFLLLLELAGTVLAVVTVIQFIWLLIKGDKNKELARFGRGFGRWFRDVIAFQTGQTEEKPFPWKGWPSDKPDA